MTRLAQEKPLSGCEWMQMKGVCPKCRQSASFKAWNWDMKPGWSGSKSSKIIALWIEWVVSEGWRAWGYGRYSSMILQSGVISLNVGQRHWASDAVISRSCVRQLASLSGLLAALGLNKVKATLKCCPLNRMCGLWGCNKCHRCITVLKSFKSCEEKETFLVGGFMKEVEFFSFLNIIEV